ncbi:MAG: O-antigen ligase family protein [Terriglobia bacterium]
MGNASQCLRAATRKFTPPHASSSTLRLSRVTPGRRGREARGLLLTSALCILVWSGYNTAIYACLDPLFPRSFLNLLHGARAFFPILAGVIAAVQLAQRQFRPVWLASGPMALLLLYAGIGLASSLLVSPEPVGATYWALQYISVIIVVMAVASGPEPEANLARYISLNWACCAAVCIGLLAGIPLLGREAMSQTAGSPLGVIAYGRLPGEVMGMAGTRNTGFGRFAGIVILVGLAKLLHDRTDKKTLFIWTPLTVAAGLALLLSQARTSCVSVVIAAAVLVARAPTRWRVPMIMIGLLALPLVFLSGLGNSFALYLTRERGFDPTLTGRTATWLEGWHVLQQSPWAGLGFWGDRLFVHGSNMQSTLFDALVQAGFLGIVPFVIALVWVWVGILRFYSTKPAGEASSLPGELLAVMTFFAVYSITEITCSFYSVGWMAMAPLIAHVQLRVFQNSRKRQSKRVPQVAPWRPPFEVPRRIHTV